METISKRLSELTIESIESYSHKIKVFAKSKFEIASCFYCNNTSIQTHGYYLKILNDLPYDNKPVYVFVNRKRFKCIDCNKTFFEKVPYQFHPYKVTTHLVNYILSQYNLMSCNALSNRVNVNRKTINSIVKELKIITGE